MRFDVSFRQTDQRFSLTLSGDGKQFSASFRELQQVTVGDVERYQGPYEVTPAVSAQTLPTRAKVMSDDLEVKAIPFYEVSNLAGGDTAYIGMMNE